MKSHVLLIPVRKYLKFFISQLHLRTRKKPRKVRLTNFMLWTIQATQALIKMKAIIHPSLNVTKYGKPCSSSSRPQYFLCETNKEENAQPNLPTQILNQIQPKVTTGAQNDLWTTMTQGNTDYYIFIQRLLCVSQVASYMLLSSLCILVALHPTRD